MQEIGGNNYVSTACGRKCPYKERIQYIYNRINTDRADKARSTKLTKIATTKIQKFKQDYRREKKKSILKKI